MRLSFSLQIFKKIAKNINTMTMIELQYVSPKLLAVHDLELAVPGVCISTLW